jgi:hypothetical protein
VEKAAFFELVKNPGEISKGTNLDELLQVIEAYPYFQSAYLFLGMAYHLRGDPRFDQWLHTIAMHVNSCEQFYQLLHPKKQIAKTELQELDQLIQQTATRYDPEANLGSNESSSKNEKKEITEDKKSAQQTILDNFLTNYQAGNFNKKQTSKSTESSADPGHAEEFQRGHDPIKALSEAAAEAALKEGNPRRAIEIYEKLSLQHPERFNYFMEKAEELKFQ